MPNFTARFLTISGLIILATPWASGKSLYPLRQIEASQLNDRGVALYMFPGWFKPRRQYEQRDGFSAIVLRITPDGRALINENLAGKGDSSVISLSGLSISEATRLWGKGRSQNDVMTFDLLTDLKSPEMDVYHLDVKFVNKKIANYRVRGIGISKPEWKTVDSVDRSKSRSNVRVPHESL